MNETYNLQTTPAGASVLKELHRLTTETGEKAPASKWFCVSPFNADTYSWYAGYLGELKTAETLQPLTGKGWTVLHSVPVGKQGSDIDHVVLSPKGNLYTLNTKHHKGKKIWVSEKQIRVDGQVVPYIRNSKYEATRVGKKAGTTVTPVLVFVDPETITIKPGAADNGIMVTTTRNLVERLETFDNTNHQPVYPTDIVYTPEFWAEKWENPNEGHQERLTWFANASKHHHTAQNMKILYGLAAVAAAFTASYIIFLEPLLSR